MFTADWIPDNELAVMGGLELDALTHGPVVDEDLRTSRAGVFAAGNLLHGAEQADVAALSGRHAGAAVARYLAAADWPRAPRAGPIAGPPLAWVSPNALSRRPVRRRAGASSSVHASSSPIRGSRSSRTGAPSGAGGSPGSCPGAPAGCRTRGRRGSTRGAGRSPFLAAARG